MLNLLMSRKTIEAIVAWEKDPESLDENQVIIVREHFAKLAQKNIS